MKIIWHARAREEMSDAAEYYDDQKAGLRDEFPAELDYAIDRIRAFPDAWAQVTFPSARRTASTPTGGDRGGTQERCRRRDRVPRASYLEPVMWNAMLLPLSTCIAATARRYRESFGAKGR
jgi:hypothetical protein